MHVNYLQDTVDQLDKIIYFFGTETEIQAPSSRIRIFLNLQRFLSGYGYRPHVSGVSGRQITTFCIRIYVWTGKFDLNPERKRCGFENIRIRVDGASVRRIDRSQAPSTRIRIFSNLQRFLPGFKSNFQLPAHTYLRIRLPDTPDTCGRQPYPERKRCGFKSIRIRVDGALKD